MFDYKRILKSPKLRYRILYFFSFIPDWLMLKIQYRIKLGRSLNLKNPQRYTEKLQWLKLNYRNALMPICVDKWDVREFVKSRGLGFILNENYGCFNSVDEIDFSQLPRKFVLKDTLGGGGVSVILVDDKAKLDIAYTKAILQGWIDSPTEKKSFGREWPYERRKHRIIIEKMLDFDASGDLPDYKFFCFDGKVFCSYMTQNCVGDHTRGVLGFFDRDFKKLDVYRTDYNPMYLQPEKPKNYDEMIKIAEKLSQGFPHVRVDLFNVDGRITFGEMTFFNGSGYVQFVPDEFDVELGKCMSLSGML